MIRSRAKVVPGAIVACHATSSLVRDGLWRVVNATRTRMSLLNPVMYSGRFSMAKIMIFIDGTWIYSNLSKLAGTAGTADLHIDYGLLPTVLAAHVQEALRL